jgi:hypothetical protein
MKYAFIALSAALALSACGENPHVLGDDPQIAGPSLSDPGAPGNAGGDKKDAPSEPSCAETVRSEVQGRTLQKGNVRFELTSVTGDPAAAIQNVYLWIFAKGDGAQGQQVELCLPQLAAAFQSKACVSFDAEYVTRSIRGLNLLRVFDSKAVLDLIQKDLQLEVTVTGPVKIDNTTLQIERANDCSKQSKDPSPVPTGSPELSI